MFGRRKQDEDPFGALKDGGTYQSQPITIPDIGGDRPSAPTLGTGAPTLGTGAPTLGTGASTGVAAAPSVTPSATPSMTPPPASPPPSTSVGQLQSYGSYRRRSSFGGFGYGWAIILRILIPLIVIGAFAIPAIHFGHSVSKISIPSFSTPSVSTPTTPGPSGPRRAASYLTPRGLRAGLAHVARVAPGARVVLLRLDSRSLSTTAVLPGGHAKLVYFGPTATMVTGTTAPGQTPVPISRIKPAVVGRLVAAMGARFHVPASRIDYMVVSSPPGLAPRWIIFAKGAAHRGYSASLSGTGLAPLP